MPFSNNEREKKIHFGCETIDLILEEKKVIANNKKSNTNEREKKLKPTIIKFSCEKNENHVLGNVVGQ